MLVEPENPLNLGFVARAMRASGVEDLVVVSPDWKKIPAEAYVTGTSAPEILNEAGVVSDLNAALRGCASAVAFSRRPSALKQEEFVLPNAPSLSGRIALVFGRESKGLTRAETALCPYLARIPCRNGVSLNLGQAVAVALFSLTATATATNGDSKERPETASMERMLALWDFVSLHLAASPRFTEKRLRRVRQLFYSMRLDDPSASLLFSVMKELAK